MNSTFRPEKAIRGRTLYEGSMVMTKVTAQLLDPEYAKPRAWDTLSWSEKDDWEALADEMNESRREPQDA